MEQEQRWDIQLEERVISSEVGVNYIYAEHSGALQQH